MMLARPTVLLVALTWAVGGCAAAPATTSTSPMAAPSPSPVAPGPSATPIPRPTPIPTLASTSEVASKAPEGAIPVVMTAVGDAEHPKPVYQPDHLTATAGTVVFFLENVPPSWASPDHDMWIGPAIGTVLAGSSAVDRNEKAVFTVNGLAQGEYVYWCAILAPDGRSHASYGMVGTLTITP